MTTPDAPSFATDEGRPLADPTGPVFDQGLRFDVETLPVALDRARRQRLINARHEWPR